MKFEYDIFKDDDIITIHNHDETFFDMTIEEFWSWVKRNEMHNWCNDYYDASESDCHGQEVGVFTKEEYFDQSYDEIKSALEKYLLMPKFKKYF